MGNKEGVGCNSFTRNISFNDPAEWISKSRREAQCNRAEPLKCHPKQTSQHASNASSSTSPASTLDKDAAGQKALVQVSPEAASHTFEGWGTSLCWFANIVGGLSDPLRNILMDLIFDAQLGLGLQICRYNIGGSGWDNPDKGVLRVGADLPSFMRPDGAFDWTADGNQRWVLLAARQRGAHIFEAFSNSPPYFMTITGHAIGNILGLLDNLAPQRYEAFADYLTEVVKHYHDTYGITFRTLDPFNEPSSPYWHIGGTQEGCHFSAESQYQVIPLLWEALQKKGMLEAGCSISASDETDIDVAGSTLRGMPPRVLALVSQINTHSYNGTMRTELAQLARAAGKRLWMSEFGCGYHPQDDIGSGLDLSAQILLDLKQMGAAAWVFWQAVENLDVGTWWGLLQMPFTTGDVIRFTKQYYVMMQYSKFIRSGATILATPSLNTLAALSPTVDGQAQVAIVSTNFETEDLVYTYDLAAFKGRGATITMYRTSQADNFAQLLSFAAPQPLAFSMVLAAQTVNTFVVDIEMPPAA